MNEFQMVTFRMGSEVTLTAEVLLAVRTLKSFSIYFMKMNENMLSKIIFGSKSFLTYLARIFTHSFMNLLVSV